MPASMTDRVRRDYTSLYVRLCDCAGPQPSTDNARADEHAVECPYRVAVEADEASPAREDADELR
jgi:hypothetical protein